MRPVRRFYVGSHPCQGYRKTSSNGWDWGLLSTGSLKFRELEPDEANGETESQHFAPSLSRSHNPRSSFSPSLVMPRARATAFVCTGPSCRDFTQSASK